MLVGYVVVADDLGVVLAVLVPVLPRMLLHLDLKEVLGDLVASEVRQRGVLDEDSSGKIVFNHVSVDDASGLASREDAGAIVSLDAVVLDAALRVDHHDAVVVERDFVFFNKEILLPLDDKNALRLGILNVVVLDLGVARLLAA